MDSERDTARIVPTHVAVIMDGNGRWAVEHGLPRFEGHRRGAATVEKIVRASAEMGIRYLTLFAFSAENWKRPKDEVDFLMKLLARFLESQARVILDNDLRLVSIGDREAIPAEARVRLDELIAQSAKGRRGTVVLALNYGSRQEILAAAKAFAADVAAGRKKPDDLDWSGLSGYLQTRDIPDPDLVIRTSGEMRISNFLLLQSAYSEFWFCRKYWPEFTPADLAEAVEEYGRRERRFGRTGEQMKNSSATDEEPLR